MKKFVWVALAFGIAACSNLPREKFCKEYGAAICASSCCDGVNAADAGACLAEWGTTCEASLAVALDAGYVTYDGQAAASCLGAFKARFETCPGKANLTEFSKPVSEACERYLVGTIREGGNCDNGGTSACVPGTSCNFANGNIRDPRVCKKFAKVGEPCGLNADCEKTTFCEAASDTCKAFVAVGGDCSTADSSCVDALPCLNGKCSARAALGAACDFATECESGQCQMNKCVAGNLYCF